MQVTLKQLESIIPKFLKTGTVPFLHSSPAIGKSSLARKMADRFHLKYIDIRLAEADPCEIGGYIYINQETKKASYYPQEMFPTEHDKIPEGYKGWLINFDEFTSATSATQAAAYKPILDKKVGQHTLHPKVVMIACGNMEDDGAIVNPMSSALVSRFAHFYVKISNPDWQEWAAANGIDYRITSYLNFKPSHLYTFHPDSADKPYASPRTWEMLSKIIKGDDTLDENTAPLIASLVGEGIAYEFLSYLKLQADLPTFAEIVKNPEGVVIKPDLSIKWSIMGMVANNITPSTAVSCCTLLDRFPDELRVVAIREIRLRHPKLLNESKEFSKWFNKVALETFAS